MRYRKLIWRFTASVGRSRMARRLIGYCRTTSQQTPEEVAQPLVEAWQQRLNGLSAVGLGTPSEQGLAESYRTACLAADCRIFLPAGTLVCRSTVSDVPKPYPLKAEGQLLHALRSDEGGVEDACCHMGRCMIMACNGDAVALREQLTLLWAGIARLCAESALPPPERLTTDGVFTEEQLCRRIQTVCEDVHCQLTLVRKSEHPLVQAALTAIQLRFREPLKLETVAKRAVCQCGISRTDIPGTDGSELPGCPDGGAHAASRTPSASAGLCVGYSGGCRIQRCQLLQPRIQKVLWTFPSEGGPPRTH